VYVAIYFIAVAAKGSIAELLYFIVNAKEATEQS